MQLRFGATAAQKR